MTQGRCHNKDDFGQSLEGYKQANHTPDLEPANIRRSVSSKALFVKSSRMFSSTEFSGQ